LLLGTVRLLEDGVSRDFVESKVRCGDKGREYSCCGGSIIC
jgi:hypothetical protein